MHLLNQKRFIANLSVGSSFFLSLTFNSFGWPFLLSKNLTIFAANGCDVWTNRASNEQLFLRFSSSYWEEHQVKDHLKGKFNPKKERKHNKKKRQKNTTYQLITVNVCSSFLISSRRRDSSTKGNLQTA